MCVFHLHHSSISIPTYSKLITLQCYLHTEPLRLQSFNQAHQKDNVFTKDYCLHVKEISWFSKVPSIVSEIMEYHQEIIIVSFYKIPSFISCWTFEFLFFSYYLKWIVSFSYLKSFSKGGSQKLSKNEKKEIKIMFMYNMQNIHLWYWFSVRFSIIFFFSNMLLSLFFCCNVLGIAFIALFLVFK